MADPDGGVTIVKAEPPDGDEVGGTDPAVPPNPRFVYNQTYRDTWSGIYPAGDLQQQTTSKAQLEQTNSKTLEQTNTAYPAMPPHQALDQPDGEQALLHKAILESYSKNIDIQSLVLEFKVTLEKFGVSQRFAAKFIMQDSSQGNLSFLLEKGKNKRWDELSPRGRIPYIKMKEWLDSPDLQIQTLNMLKNCKEEKKVGLSEPWPRRERFSAFQQTVLCRLFEENSNPSMGTRSAVGEKLNIPLERINVWFQNQRARGFPAKRILQQTLGAAGADASDMPDISFTAESPKTSSGKDKPGLPLFDYPKMLQQVTGYSTCSNTADGSSPPVIPDTPKHTGIVPQKTSFPTENFNINPPKRKRKSIPKVDYTTSPSFVAKNSVLEPYNPYFLTGTAANQMGINSTQLEQMTSALLKRPLPDYQQRQQPPDTYQPVGETYKEDSPNSFTTNLEKTLNAFLDSGGKISEDAATKTEPNEQNYSQSGVSSGNQLESVIERLSQQNQKSSISSGDSSDATIESCVDNQAGVGDLYKGINPLKMSSDVVNDSRKVSKRKRTIPKQSSVEYEEKFGTFASDTDSTCSTKGYSASIANTFTESTINGQTKGMREFDTGYFWSSNANITLPGTAHNEVNKNTPTCMNTDGSVGETKRQKLDERNETSTCDRNQTNEKKKELNEGNKTAACNDKQTNEKSEDKSLSSVQNLSRAQLEVLKAMCSSIVKQDNGSSLEEPDLD